MFYNLTRGRIKKSKNHKMVFIVCFLFSLFFLFSLNVSAFNFEGETFGFFEEPVIIPGNVTNFNNVTEVYNNNTYVNVYDQSLNTTDDVTFNSIEGDGSKLTNLTLPWATILNYTETTNNATLVEWSF